MNTENSNSKPGSPKLKVFRKEDGACLPMDVLMGTLMDENLIVDGESLILEFCTSETVLESSDKLLNVEKYNK